jgi:hypothetical protein
MPMKPPKAPGGPGLGRAGQPRLRTLKRMLARPMGKPAGGFNPLKSVGG